jgi:hypothetical protein
MNKGENIELAWLVTDCPKVYKAASVKPRPKKKTTNSCLITTLVSTIFDAFPKGYELSISIR